MAKSTFKEGKTYHGFSFADTDTKIQVKVKKRTPGFVEVSVKGWTVDQKRFKVKIGSIGGRQYEYIRLGNYSLAPIISAEYTKERN